jgi:hypothetical protein
MTDLIRAQATSRSIAAFCLAALFMLPAWTGTYAQSSPFDTLLGSWRGSGQVQLSDGRKERLKCNVYYTGGGANLGMAIRCQSESQNVEIRSKLSQTGGRVTGTWEERTFNASGSAAGQIGGGKVSLRISGGINGSMQVSYSPTRQNVSISTSGGGLKSVQISLSRS